MSKIQLEGIDDVQHIPDGTLTLDRLELCLLLIPSLGAFLCGSFFGLGLIHFGVPIPVEIMLLYVLEVLYQAPVLDALIMIPRDKRLLIRREGLSVLVVQLSSPARADGHDPLADRAGDLEVPVVIVAGHSVSVAVVQEVLLLFLILVGDGIAALAKPVTGLECFCQGRKRTKRLRVEASGDETVLCVHDLSVAFFTVIKHE